MLKSIYVSLVIGLVILWLNHKKLHYSSLQCRVEATTALAVLKSR